MEVRNMIDKFTMTIICPSTKDYIHLDLRSTGQDNHSWTVQDRRLASGIFTRHESLDDAVRYVLSFEVIK